MSDYSVHLTQVESLLKAIREKAPAKDKEVMYLAERAISHLWEIRDTAELGYPLPDVQEQPAFTPHEQGHVMNMPRARMPGQY